MGNSPRPPRHHVKMFLTDDGKTLLIGPDAASFRKAQIPDLSNFKRGTKFQRANRVIGFMNLTTLPPPLDSFMYTFARRTEGAFLEYKNARTETLAYLKTAPEAHSIHRYVLALHHWESFLGQAWHGLETVRLAASLPLWFVRGDGSTYEKLSDVYGAMKHAESRIEAGQANGRLWPSWIHEDGIHSDKFVLSYREAADILKEIGKLAKRLQSDKGMGKLIAKYPSFGPSGA